MNTGLLYAQTMAADALGRPDWNININEPIQRLRGKRVLVTGAAGSLGSELLPVLWKIGAFPLATDIVEGENNCVPLDVRDLSAVLQTTRMFEPDLIIHLAAEKLAPKGEVYPYQTADTNINGTKNVLDMGIKTVFASTTKAANPHCAYGQSKAIAERMVLNAGQSVSRYSNVLEAGPSVLTIWNEVAADEPLPVMDCSRYLITFKEAIALTLWTAILPAGRYKVYPGEPVQMTELASRLFPDRTQLVLPRRRGDRPHEPLHGAEEWTEPAGVDNIERIISYHDA